jgi:hypothetical protein
MPLFISFFKFFQVKSLEVRKKTCNFAAKFSKNEAKYLNLSVFIQEKLYRPMLLSMQSAKTVKSQNPSLLVRIPLALKKHSRKSKEGLKETQEKDTQPKSVIVDFDIYEKLAQNEYLASIGFLKSLRLHSGGYAVFQKGWRKCDGSYKIETIYLHKLIGEKYLPKPENPENHKLVINLKNGNKLDCRLENLEWVNMSVTARRSRVQNKSGYRGVYREKNGCFRATIYINKKRVHIGMFKTAEEAAKAYEKYALENFGEIPKKAKIKRAKASAV